MIGIGSSNTRIPKGFKYVYKILPALVIEVFGLLWLAAEKNSSELWYGPYYRIQDKFITMEAQMDDPKYIRFLCFACCTLKESSDQKKRAWFKKQISLISNNFDIKQS